MHTAIYNKCKDLNKYIWSLLKILTIKGILWIDLFINWILRRSFFPFDIYIFYILYWTGECGNCRPVVVQSDNRVFFGGGRVNVVVRRGGTCPRDSDRHPHPETRWWYVSQSLIKPGILYFRVSLNLLKISVSGSY